MFLAKKFHGIINLIFLLSLFTLSFSNEIVNEPTLFVKGEAIEIKSYPDTNSFPNGIYKISSEGILNMPIIGDLQIDTLTNENFYKLVKSVYTSFLSYPNISIKPVIRVCLSGGFSSPGIYWVSPTIGLSDVVKLGGQLTREDSFEKIEWKRDRKSIDSDVVTLIQNNNSLSSIGFESGDQITVTANSKRDRLSKIGEGFLPILSAILAAGSFAILAYQIEN